MQMKQSRRLWHVIALVSILTTCFFVIGLGYAIKTVMFPQPSNLTMEPPKEEEASLLDENFTILGLGDSLTIGTGDQSSHGYIRHVFEALKENNDEHAKLINFAANGYRTTQLLEDIKQRPGVIAAIKQADMITLTIGGNDIFSVGEEVNVAAARERMPDSINTIDQILSNLAELNPNAFIYYIGLYNPFIELEQSEDTSLFVQDWNHEVFKIVNRYPNLTLVPTFDLFEKNVMSYLSSDHYHPNQEGYKLIADRIIQTIQ
jgi:lysophospholipase L1-like esterase